MSINLFEHNKKAYDSALEMLAKTKKAAIIHPTGTGKSFIGFELADNFSQKRICWLSPSEYIFKTQLENLKNSGTNEPCNISFFTYAKLMNMSEEETLEIKPDYIILDEFHRCGAEQWGKGVQNLINMYGEVPILGLSATNIRYLDNQRDMADELFDGNIASEITLGEAIVRGILLPPKYITTVFSYQKDLEKYEYRVAHAKSKAVKNAGEKYLEALRRALEKADGLDEVFSKHIEDKSGKFIVFCANKEHMDEMKSHVNEFFNKIDTAPHIYSVYSDDPEASSDFAEFKADNSDHLKLLFCIDMLNEGVHVDDISGVILFRPTVSPIVYKQQIGRALSASKEKLPLIFDIVNNFENLYSIGTIEQEMQVAINYYHSYGSDSEIVTEKFKIIDEVCDCKKIFDDLNETLTASWDFMYTEAKKYALKNGNLEVPKKYKTENGYSLGAWITTQRQVRFGNIYGSLSEKRVKKLDDIGIVWETVRDTSWQKNLLEAQNYYKENNNLDTNVNYVTKTGFSLGKWICQLRTYRKNGINQAYLTSERIKELDKIGMIWSSPDYVFEQNFMAAMNYYKEFGNLDVPLKYVTKDGINLSSWMHVLRAKMKGKANTVPLTDEQIARLNSIGMLWSDKFSRNWEIGFNEAKKFFLQNNNLNVPANYITKSGYKLGTWLAHQREKGGENVDLERKKKLSGIGMVWEKEDSWQTRYELVKKYYMKNGNLNIPQKYVDDGVWLNKWLNEQKQIYHKKRKNRTLSPEQISLLEQIGFDWMDSKDRAWLTQFGFAKKYYELFSDLNVPRTYKTENGTNLANWLIVQKKQYRDGKLTQKQIGMLEEIGMSFTVQAKKQQINNEQILALR